MAHRLLVIEDLSLVPKASLDSLLPLQADFSCEYIPWDSSLIEKLSTSDAHLIVILPAAETERAMSVYRWLGAHSLAIPTLAVLSDQSGEELVRLVSETADDFAFWPLRPHEFPKRVSRLLGKEARDRDSIRDRLTHELGLAQLVGKDPTFVRTIEKIPLLATSDAPVLLLGETGTGKELCARAIHYLSKRTNLPFIPVECGAIPEHLAENELFGHARGAFTDASADQKGLAAMAEGGTLFLDEVDALPLAAQAKLLRFLQEGTYRPLGSERFALANVRVIAATNCDLEARVREKQFRSDLYFRLNVLQLQLPPLRERRGDIGLLAHHFLRSLARTGSERKTLSPATLRVLEQHNWPGNLRELFNVLQRAVVFCPGAQILPNHISLAPLPATPPPADTNFRKARLQAIETFERRYVEDMLRKHRGNITRAAAEAAKDRRSFGRLVKKYGVERQAF